LEKQGVAFTPGIDFRSRRTDHVWFFYKRELTELKEGVRRIKEFSPCRIILKMGGIDIMKHDAILKCIVLLYFWVLFWRIPTAMPLCFPFSI